ncbi:MAG: hypothetical protein GYB31_02560 [Bacteroidetes bacterium]|nr:hypothetical protein [Bacteroidota bacterium]
MRFIFVCSIFLLASFQTTAQDNWRKHVKIAEEHQRKAEYAEAAEHFRFAWVLKPGKRDLIEKAAKNYDMIKDYGNAAEAWRALINRKKYPLAGFQYALALKQQEKYQEASRAFASFKDFYKEKDVEYWGRRADMEILGCELALRTPRFSEKPKAVIRRPGITVNTETTDFAPLPVSENILYFSSTRGDRARIYRAEESAGAWSSASLPSNFPMITEDHYCNGTLTPDNQRFYFTICKSESSLTTRCEIYVTQRIDNAWASPERLDDYINDPNATTTHPMVVHNGDTEILYFSSNREGGEGGMDIWFATRNVNGSNTDFTLPMNLGDDINTKRDEITPFYALETATLYFSSNGHPSVGGFDIFQSSGSRAQWDRPENMEFPFNSGADDFYYVLKQSRSGGYLVSNRATDDKPTTTDEDIFSFYFPNATKQDLKIRGEAFNKESGQRLRDLTVTLYQENGPGNKVLIDAYFFPEGVYELSLPRDKRYLMEFKSPRHSAYSQIFNPASHQLEDEIVIPVHLRPETQEEPPMLTESSIPPGDETDEPMITESSDPEKEGTTVQEDAESEKETPSESEPTPYTIRGQSPADDYEVITAAPRNEGTYYKVQLIAVVNYNENHSRYKPVKDLGRIDTEYIIDRKLYRVLLADFGTLEEAKEMLEIVKTRGFEGAYLVKYTDGQRMGRVR